ncbi:hypothetical protein A0H81_03433 [Grifola frondosa]|uniref:Uncharacterized protein n=1 Tax=Grifola frondosa TaxID=5627 RepID=A0A1C7MJ14_GRIFR|nr:hypothetical protein A0H81_03433 [Grifola frondosa]
MPIQEFSAMPSAFELNSTLGTAFLGNIFAVILPLCLRRPAADVDRNINIQKFERYGGAFQIEFCRLQQYTRDQKDASHKTSISQELFMNPINPDHDAPEPVSLHEEHRLVRPYVVTILHFSTSSFYIPVLIP